jgi:ERCC4-related helicase
LKKVGIIGGGFVERVLEANTMAILLTALGKTVIAGLVTAELLQDI